MSPITDSSSAKSSSSTGVGEMAAATLLLFSMDLIVRPSCSGLSSSTSSPFSGAVAVVEPRLRLPSCGVTLGTEAGCRFEAPLRWTDTLRGRCTEPFKRGVLSGGVRRDERWGGREDCFEGTCSGALNKSKLNLPITASGFNLRALVVVM
jgi:hypothetical protein